MQNLKKIQFFSKMMQFFAPNYAVKFAYKLFSTPFKFDVPEREQMMRESSQVERVYVQSIDKEIDVLSYGYSPKRVLLVHGWAGRPTQFFRLADKLLENGYMVITFDGPAHGNSEGKMTNILEFVEVIKHLYVKYDGFTSAVGHSFGGMALYNASKTVRFDSFVTIGAANKVSDVTSSFCNDLGMSEKTAKRLDAFIENKFQLKITDYDSETFKNDLNVPVLIVHDENDKEVDVKCATEINKAVTNSKLHITKGLGHKRILKDVEVADDIVEFIKQY